MRSICKQHRNPGQLTINCQKKKPYGLKHIGGSGCGFLMRESRKAGEEGCERIPRFITLTMQHGRRLLTLLPESMPVHNDAR